MAIQGIYYVDVSKLGKDVDGSKDAPILINQQAVVESVMNIIYTEPGERVMSPDFGCGLRGFLFQPIDDITTVIMQKTIETALEQYEPRITSLHVQVTPHEDDNTYIINIIFSTGILGNQQKLSFQLNKVR